MEGSRYVPFAPCEQQRGADATQESGAEVIELNNDDPVALEATFRYIYTSELREACPRRWEIDHWSHLLEVMFVSDKYGLPSLSSAALELMQMGATPAADDVHIILKLLRRAAEFPTHGKQMKAIMLSICQVSLYDNFDDADFLQWLDDHDEIRHEIYKENIDWL